MTTPQSKSIACPAAALDGGHFSRGRFFSLMALLLGTTLCCTSAPIATPYAQKGRLAIKSVTPSATAVPQYGMLEFTVALSATYDNPFDPEDVALDAHVNCPSGKSLSVPGFLYRAYSRELDNNRESLRPAGEPVWKIRFAPMETGAHTAVVSLKDRTGRVESQPVRFNVTASTNSGFIRISRINPRYFAFDSGAPYYPIGANVCWAGSRGTYDYDAWFGRYAEVGANYARLWLSPHWSTFALERPGKPEAGLGMGQFDLANAWRIDYVLELGATRGIQIMLCIDSYNILRERDGYPQWDSMPHNAKNGGPLTKPTDFWTNPEMARLYRNKLRYLVARYGAFANVLSWEFWNEVDITTSYPSGLSRDWHQRMATTLRAIDPFKHLITTSFAGSDGDPQVDKLPELDYVQTHNYNSPDMPLALARYHARKVAYGKPHIVGEIGADSGGPRAKDDPKGYQIHDPIWVSIAIGASGTAQPWWWDNAIHPLNLYYIFGAAVKFCHNIDWPAEGFSPVKATVAWQTAPQPAPRKDVNLRGGPATWTRSEFNQPKTIRVRPEGVEGPQPLAGIQHGLGGHKDKHNPVTFEYDLPYESKLEVDVGDVSGYGGAILSVKLDGNEVLRKEFADPDGMQSTATLKQYAGAYTIDVPAGKHTVVVENVGPDWFMVSYCLRKAVTASGPPVLAWAVAGKNTAVAWARLEAADWRRLCVSKEKIEPAPPSVLEISNILPGRWKAETWDTWNGRVVKQADITVSSTGTARLSLDGFSHDVAIKLLRQGPGN